MASVITYEHIKAVNAQLKTMTIKGKEYVNVAERVRAFRMLYPQGSIETEMLSLEGGVCVMRALVRDEDGRILGTGTAFEKQDSSYINKTSFIENAETSACGRALGFAGFGIDVSIASADEMQGAISQQEGGTVADFTPEESPAEAAMHRRRVAMTDLCGRLSIPFIKDYKFHGKNRANKAKRNAAIRKKLGMKEWEGVGDV